jgi:hypothetical protein
MCEDGTSPVGLSASVWSIYDGVHRFNRWSVREIWQQIFETAGSLEPPEQDGKPSSQDVITSPPREVP